MILEVIPISVVGEEFEVIREAVDRLNNTQDCFRGNLNQPQRLRSGSPVDWDDLHRG